MAKLSRTSIPDKLITAKRSAMRYFSPKGTRALTEAAALYDPKHNVVGIGIGHKLVKGKSTGDHAIRFYVERKIDKKVVPKSFLLPKRIGNVGTDVIETGRFVVLQPRRRKRMRPVRPGCSIGCQPRDGHLMAATLGAIVAKKGQHFVLSMCWQTRTGCRSVRRYSSPGCATKMRPARTGLQNFPTTSG